MSSIGYVPDAVITFSKTSRAGYTAQAHKKKLQEPAVSISSSWQKI